MDTILSDQIRNRGFGGTEAPMAYDKHQATAEFNRWSESYDRSILQWLLFGPSHRALIRRIRTVAGDRPIKILDVGCGTGVFAARLRAAFPDAHVWGIDLVAGMLAKGSQRWRTHAGRPFVAFKEHGRRAFKEGCRTWRRWLIRVSVAPTHGQTFGEQQRASRDIGHGELGRYEDPVPLLADDLTRASALFGAGHRNRDRASAAFDFLDFLTRRRWTRG